MSDLKSVSALEKEIEEMERQAGIISQKPEEEVIEEGDQETPPQTTPEDDPEEASFKKRYADLRRHSQRQVDSLKEELAGLKDQLKNAQNSSSPTSVEEVKKWAEENPKAAAIIREIARDATPPKDDYKKVSHEISLMKSEANIRKAHPDFDDITSDTAFHDWAERQPKKLQDMIYGSDADDVIWALHQFKKEKPQPDTSADSAKAVTKSRKPDAPGNKGKAFSESQVNAMSLPEYEANEEAIRESMKNGSFVYDLSGGAR